LAGLAAAAAWIFTRNYFRHSLDNSGELEALGLPLFATITLVPGNSKSSKNSPIAISDPSNTVVEAFRGLRTGLKFSQSSAKSKKILITSSVPGQGKSFISQNLAVVLASTGKKVLLVDADMRRGALHKAFGQKLDEAGLSASLAGIISFEDVLQATEVDSLKLIHRGKRPPNPAELLEDAKLLEFLNWAENAFDFIIIDTPPVLAVADPIIIAQHDLITIVVARHLQTTAEEIEYTLRRLEMSGIKVSGAILNGYDQKRSKYGAYSYKYGYYYGDYK
ncbi:MAG: CpsD/CapB family tyrosine-protein kinase, partial [Roseovarius sp.]